MTVDSIQLRQRFLDFFDARMKDHAKAEGHGVSQGALGLPSSSLIPPDASTLFTSAGMHQFKDDFTGNLVHNTRAAATVQKCMRTPDLENVGRTARHHTFFEMLGFFSFGDGLHGPNGSVGFFKMEAIRWIWDFYTLPWDQGGCGLDKAKLYVSVYKGDETGADRDTEAMELWTKILQPLHPGVSLPGTRIFELGEHDNFWPAGAPSQGPNGVCGPCSEIFFDCGPQYGQGDVASNGARFMEIGNIVFTQYERSGPTPGKGTLTPLPAKNIDFGGGFERLVMVLEAAPTTLDSSLFMPLRHKLRDLAAGNELDPTGTAYQKQLRKQLKAGARRDALEITDSTPEFAEEFLVREKRIADHIRAAVFCMADGVLPSNEKQGYIIRRIIRRAYRDGSALGFSGPFLHKLVPVLLESYAPSYPELKRNITAVASTIQQEEQQFATTLERGLQLLAGLIQQVKEKGEKVIGGEPAFNLYQSQGLPLEVVRDEARAQGLEVDQIGYEQAKQSHKGASGAGKQVAVFEKGWFADLKSKFAPTKFLGYEVCESPVKVLSIAVEGQPVDSLEAGQNGVVVLDRTPFYAESGGQVGDRGTIKVSGATFEVADTKKRDDYFLHEGAVILGRVKVGDTAEARVDVERRSRIRANHSATHLMHAALRKVLGDHVVQRGSEVRADGLRFDFSHAQAVSFDERQKIEALVNQQVQANVEVSTEVMAPEDAQRVGAMALFGEKYGDKVRVLTMGTQGFSKELCGGTHVARTGDIGYFRIVSEGSSSAGVRRIEGVTGQDACTLAAEDARLLAQLHALTKAQPGKVLEKVDGLIKEVKDLKGKAKSGPAVTAGLLDQLNKIAETIGDASLYVSDMGLVEASDLLTIKDALGQDARPHAILLGARGEGRASLLLALSKELVSRGLHAGKIVGEIARLVGGGGGGKPEIAQAGGKNPEAMSEALDLGRTRLRGLIEKSK
ncbi:MAG: alanine--tRNA ligase [Planctomycetes bacterium]|nr:alanine--tRNA ligase [Planctomycetota bacterium]